MTLIQENVIILRVILCIALLTNKMEQTMSCARPVGCPSGGDVRVAGQHEYLNPLRLRVLASCEVRWSQRLLASEGFSKCPEDPGN